MTNMIPIAADGGSVVKELLAAGGAMSAKPVDVPLAEPHVLVPPNYSLKMVPIPEGKVSRQVKFQDVTSFAEYVNRYMIQGGTLILANVGATQCTLKALIDYNPDPVLLRGQAPASWWSHEAVLECVLTPDWKLWMENNGSNELFTQTEFAQFLEDNERLFRSPGAAELLELVTTLEGKSNVRFNAAVRLQNGKSRLDFEEDVSLQGGTGTGAIEVPKELVLAIIPFENGPKAYEVRARLRYRIQSRSLVFWYETIVPHLILRDAAQAVMDAVREKVKCPLLIGN